MRTAKRTDQQPALVGEELYSRSRSGTDYVIRVALTFVTIIVDASTRSFLLFLSFSSLDPCHCNCVWPALRKEVFLIVIAWPSELEVGQHQKYRPYSRRFHHLGDVLSFCSIKSSPSHNNWAASQYFATART